MSFQSSRLSALLAVTAVAVVVSGCGPAGGVLSNDGTTAETTSLPEHKRDFQTTIVATGPDAGPAPQPPGDVFEMVRYPSNVGELVAYVTKPTGDRKRPAIIWITGGDNNSIGDVWSPADPENDQGATTFRENGFVMMFPSQRGGNDNPGQREGFYGEVDDVIAAADFLAKRPDVDPDRIYLGGHSTGGTLVLLVAASTDRFAAVFSLGPVATPLHYGGNFLYSAQTDEEMVPRSPIVWVDQIKTPTFILEGESGNWDSIVMMKESFPNPNVHYYRVAGKDHFDAIRPINDAIVEMLADGDPIDPNHPALTTLTH